MTLFPPGFYNELQQIGVDFEDTAQVEAFDRNQKSSSPEAERSAGFEIVEADYLTPESAQYVCKKIPVESPSNQPIS